jgi:hypothetical protein
MVSFKIFLGVTGVFGPCSSSLVPKDTKNTTFRKVGLFPSSGDWWETPD